MHDHTVCNFHIMNAFKSNSDSDKLGVCSAKIKTIFITNFLAQKFTIFKCYLQYSSAKSTSFQFRKILIQYSTARFIRPVARVGSGDPVRVLRLYTTNTLDEVCSIYC